ncbi:MAG TPA: TetR/AcrR family transcriptional regulator [Candidatus Acidoferrales bacterium]|jgi:AcrR family transcriptional regulator|nr:TetR/AcrR family transcriptional regulator [Candidatus Acidoferrales bacterium]
MTEAHHRKKHPAQVRLALLEGAASIIVEQGLTALSVQSVSDAAGVTKGGFFHHFPSRQALLDGLFEWLLSGFDGSLDALIAADPEPFGCFTRAYVRSVFDDDRPGGRWDNVWISTMSDSELKMKWMNWFEARLRRHRLTDAGPTLEAVRLTVDGIWLSRLSGVPLRHPDEIRASLIASTYKKSSVRKSK